MTRSDITLQLVRLDRMDNYELKELIYKLKYKIDSVYTILFELEKDEDFQRLAALLRRALER